MKMLKVWGGILVTVLLVVFSLTRIAFEVLGASTAPDDFQLLKQRMPHVLEWLFTTPWIVPTVIIVLMSGGAAWLLWSGLRGVALTPSAAPIQARKASESETGAIAQPSYAAEVYRDPYKWWTEREDRQGNEWTSISLTLTTPQPLHNAMAFITKLHSGAHGSWAIDGATHKCRLGWPGKGAEQYIPRRIVSSEQILLLDYEKARRHLYFHSDAEYAGFKDYAYHPAANREGTLGLLPGAYEIEVTVEADGGIASVTSWLLFWGGDPEKLMLIRFEVPAGT